MSVGSLFSGIGGLELGLERAGFKTIWQVESDEYARKVLQTNFPGVELFHDVREVGAHNLRPVDLICGGFPCQPFSTASRGRKVAENLWPEMLRVVCDLRPRFVVAENVSRSAIEAAGVDLSDNAYSCGIVCLPAALVSAPHERMRWFLVADSNRDSKSRIAQHAEMAFLPHLAGFAPWYALPERLGVDDGVPSRMDRLRCLGNAVVPQVAEHIGRIVLALANTGSRP